MQRGINTILYRWFKFFLNLFVILFLGCSGAQEFKKECGLCKEINQKELQKSLINFIYNDKSFRISEEAENQLLKIKGTLRQGHKFTECGCKGNKLIYRLWCANDETFELEVSLVENNQFVLTRIQAAEFPHP